MASMVFDTETTGLDKPFCYDVGYLINCDNGEKIKRHFVIEQTWHNLQLFESAYYANKRPLYVQLMRQHKAIMDKWGYVTRQMYRDIKTYNVKVAYAYNSNFDDKVFAFNCNWFHCNNPLEEIPIYDIWGYASQFITNTAEYKQFCEDNNFFTSNGNYSGSAETVYRYITNNPTFEEEHMGLPDSLIEGEILDYCITDKLAVPETEYKVNKILEREVKTPYKIKVNGTTIHEGEYTKQYNRGGTFYFNEEIKAD